MRGGNLLLLLPLVVLAPGVCNAKILSSLWHSIEAWLHVHFSGSHTLDGTATFLWLRGMQKVI